MFEIAPPIIAATLVGAASGALAAWAYLRHSHRRRPKPQPIRPADPAVSSEEIERVAEAWAEAQGRPEATGLMADKLHLLHDIGKRRGWLR